MRPIEHASMIPICQASGNVGVGGEVPTRKPRHRPGEPAFPPRFRSALVPAPITRPARQIAIRIDPFPTTPFPTNNFPNSFPRTGSRSVWSTVSTRRARSVSRHVDGYPVAEGQRERECVCEDEAGPEGVWITFLGAVDTCSPRLAPRHDLKRRV